MRKLSGKYSHIRRMLMGGPKPQALKSEESELTSPRTVSGADVAEARCVVDVADDPPAVASPEPELQSSHDEAPAPLRCAR